MGYCGLTNQILFKSIKTELERAVDNDGAKKENLCFDHRSFFLALF